MRRFFHPAHVFLSGLLAALPVMLTVIVIVWAAGFLQQFLGPGSAIGRFLISIGLVAASTPLVAYLFGFVFVIALIYLLGLLVEAGLKGPIRALVDAILLRIPLVRTIYDLSSRFIGVLDQQDHADLKTMRPVWCFFGGEGGTAVLALLPTPEAIIIEGHRYHMILVPTAPVPIGGGLLCVPVAWVKPAPFGIEGLTSIYVSMGVTASKYLPPTAVVAPVPA